MMRFADLGARSSSALLPLVFSSSPEGDRQILEGALAIHSEYWRRFRYFLVLTVEMDNPEVEATQI